MSCDDVADCIETSPTVRAALNSFIPAVPIDGYIFPPGTSLTPSQMTSRLNPIDACAFDPYWAQVEQYVDFMVNLGQDVLDQIALYNAALDAGENLPMGKFLGKLKNTSTGGKVLEFLQWVLTTVKAAYEAQDNAANRDAIKCAIFCQFRDDCLITIQGTLDVLNDRLGGLLVPSDLDDLPTMVDAFIAAAFDPALALDLWLTFLMGSAKTAGMFGLEGIDETLQLVLEAAVNDANNDWEVKCDDCDTPPPGDAWTIIVAPGYETGVIAEQTLNSVEFDSELSFDGIWRVNAERLVDCPPLTGVSVTGATITYIYKELCAGGSSSSPITSGDEIRNFAYAANGPFNIVLYW